MNASRLSHVMRGWRGDTLALLAGAAMPLAFAPWRQGWLAPLLLALLFASWLTATPRRALWRGWLFGTAQFTVGVHWVYTSMHVYGAVPGIAAALFVVLFAMALALLPGWTGFMLRRWFAAPLPVFLLLAAPFAWTLVEWVRGWLLTGFPWLEAGYSQTGLPLQGFAPLLGVHGVTLFTAMSAGLLACAVIGGAWRRPYAIVALGLLWVSGALLDRIDWSRAAGEPFSVALVQANIDQHRKWQPAYRRRIIDRYVTLSRPHFGRAVIIWPETAVPAFWRDVAQRRLLPFAAQAYRQGSQLLIGVPMRLPRGRGYYNAVVALGDGVAFYHKRHLVPFGEYVPLREYLANLLAIMNAPMADFVPGEARQPPIRLAGHPVAVAICYEIAFGSEMAADLPQARLLVNVSNNAWFGRSSAAHQQLQMGQMRARESGRYLLVATNDGVTAIVDHRGRVRAALPRFTAGVLTGDVVPRSGATPYVRMRDWPLTGIAIAVLLLIRARYRRQRGVL